MSRTLFLALEVGKAVLVPSTALIIALTIGVVLLWSPWRNGGRWLITLVIGILVLVATLPVASWLAEPLEMRFPPIQRLPKSVAGIISLGGAFETVLTSEWGQPQLNNHAERLIAFAALAHKYPNLQLVFSGGPTDSGSQHINESDIARDLLGSIGMETDRIIFENRSRNTCENAIYTEQLLRPLKQQTWVLITSAMDMPRAVGVFRAKGFQILPYPVDYTTGNNSFDYTPTLVRNLARLDHAAHEWLGLLAYRVLGCTDVLFPRPDGVR